MATIFQRINGLIRPWVDVSSYFGQPAHAPAVHDEALLAAQTVYDSDGNALPPGLIEGIEKDASDNTVAYWFKEPGVSGRKWRQTITTETASGNVVTWYNAPELQP